MLGHIKTVIDRGLNNSPPARELARRDALEIEATKNLALLTSMPFGNSSTPMLAQHGNTAVFRAEHAIPVNVRDGADSGPFHDTYTLLATLKKGAHGEAAGVDFSIKGDLTYTRYTNTEFCREGDFDSLVGPDLFGARNCHAYAFLRHCRAALEQDAVTYNHTIRAAGTELAKEIKALVGEAPLVLETKGLKFEAQSPDAAGIRTLSIELEFRPKITINLNDRGEILTMSRGDSPPVRFTYNDPVDHFERTGEIDPLYQDSRRMLSVLHNGILEFVKLYKDTGSTPPRAALAGEIWQAISFDSWHPRMTTPAPVALIEAFLIRAEKTTDRYGHSR